MIAFIRCAKSGIFICMSHPVKLAGIHNCATYCCTGKTTDGVNSVESCIEYMQELFDEEFAQAGL